ncbi:DMT family transporter [Alkalibacter saccharofermentans]|uniref:RarD protein n=1 Tax=Alkalibacter saccharofermentans DSM 14828 TaxID=1120975 RepID=A0A1M4WDD1_9FIRM|nr:DMT family transporter [Alkalibacter saccharofermentans]SHE79187.1 rarD protein [Alkalibacter saccharofermentans DSM 14828]
MVRQNNIITYYSKYMLALMLFGSNGIVASQISLTSYEIVFLRTLIGSILLLVLFKSANNKIEMPKNKQHLFYLVVSGFAMGVSWMFLYEAYQQIGVSIASLAYYCGPVIVMVLSPLLFKEKFTLPKVAGFVAILFGILLINIQAIHDGKTAWGLFCGVMSATMYAFMVIFNKKAHTITGMRNSMFQLTISFFTVAIFLGLQQGFAINISRGDWLPIFILGFINTGIGCYLYFSSIGNLPVQTVAIFGYIEPLSAVAFSVLFLGEILQPIQFLGSLLVIGGAIFAEGILKQKNPINNTTQY